MGTNSEEACCAWFEGRPLGRLGLDGGGPDGAGPSRDASDVRPGGGGAAGSALGAELDAGAEVFFEEGDGGGEHFEAGAFAGD